MQISIYPTYCFIFSISVSLKPHNLVLYAHMSQGVSQLAVDALGGIAGTVNALRNVNSLKSDARVCVFMHTYLAFIKMYLNKRK